MTNDRLRLGRLGEQAACARLLEAGYMIKHCNWRCRSGEIDIIAEQAGRLVFIEVRTRMQGGKFGTAAESVDRRKQLKVRATAQVYMQAVKRSDAAVRFDVIAIEMGLGDSIQEYKHYEAAF